MPLVFYIFKGPTLVKRVTRTNPKIMADIAKKSCANRCDGEVRATKGRPGRSRKLAEWQTELVMSLDGRSGVRFRRVRFDELVIPGDYIKEGENCYEPWEGPRGFRAASFCKPVYRPERTSQLTAGGVKKTDAKSDVTSGA
jgi:hypothetical protein